MKVILSGAKDDSMLLPRLQTAINCVLVAAVDGECGLEGFLRDFPHGFIVGVGVAVGHEQSVEEFEEVPRDAQGSERRLPR